MPIFEKLKPIHLAAVSLALGVLWDVLFYNHVPGISVPIFWVALLATIALFDRLTHRHMRWHDVGLSVVILVLSSFFALRASGFLLALDSIAIIYLFFLLLSSLYGARVRSYDLVDFLVFPLLDLFDAILKQSGILREFRLAASERTRRIVVGVAAAFVIGVVFVALFSSADLVVSKLLNSVFAPDFLTKVVRHVITVGMVSIGLLLAFAPAFWRRRDPREIKAPHWNKEIGLEAAIVFAVSNVLFLGFILVQAVYLFGGQDNIAKFDITYASYAREGFFQLLVVALIVALLVWAMRYTNDGRYKRATEILAALLIGQTFVILASSWTRLSLYEQAFGFTDLRLFSHYFLIVVAVIMAIILASLIFRFSNNHLLTSFIWVFALALIGLNLLNPDAFVAQANIARAEAGERLDYRQLFEDLSDDAAPAIGAYVSSDAFQSVFQEQIDCLKTLHENTEKIVSLHNTVRGKQASPELAADQAELASLEAAQQALPCYANREPEVKTELQTWLSLPAVTDWQSWNLSRMDAQNIRDTLNASGTFATN